MADYEHQPAFQKEIIQKMRLYSFSPAKENRRFNRLLEKFDIPYQTYQVLALLLHHPDGMEPSRIADTFSILRQTVTNIADAMEKRGYLERVRSAADRRCIYLRLLPEGIERTTEMKHEIDEYHKRVMVHFSEEELETYFSFRKKLMEHLDAELEATLAAKNN